MVVCHILLACILSACIRSESRWPKLLTEIPEPKSIYSFPSLSQIIAPLLWVKIRFGAYVGKNTLLAVSSKSVAFELLFNFNSDSFSEKEWIELYKLSYIQLLCLFVCPMGDLSPIRINLLLNCRVASNFNRRTRL